MAMNRNGLMTSFEDVVPIDSVEGVARNESGEWSYAHESNKKLLTSRSFPSKEVPRPEISKHLRKIRQQEYSGLVLDFRICKFRKLHHAELLANVLIDQTDLARVKARDGDRMIRTESGTVLPNIPTVVLSDNRITGNTFFGNRRSRSSRIGRRFKGYARRSARDW